MPLSTKVLHADNEDSNQIARMRSLIWVFVGRTCPKVRSAVAVQMMQSVKVLVYNQTQQRYDTEYNDG